MPHIVLTDEQLKIVTAATAPIEARDSQGRTVAQLTPLDAIDLAAIERRKQRGSRPGPTIPSEQVQAHLRRLDEIRQSEGLDEAKMLDLLRRMQAGEPV
jgi:antitoxin (DNA-binding transcriptional repressor) of toxin-antitoxin stability system